MYVFIVAVRKAERREVATAASILYAYSDLAVEQRMRTQRVARKTCATKPVKSTDAAASFKYDAWKHFGFRVARNEDGEKVTERQKSDNLLPDNN